MGDRIYIKKINPRKLESRYYGPCRVVESRGSIVWARDLSRPEKVFQIHIDRAKMERHVTIEESKSIGDIFPSEKPVEPAMLEGITQENPVDEDVLGTVNATNTMDTGPSIINDQETAEVNINHRYPLRNRLNRDK